MAEKSSKQGKFAALKAEFGKIYWHSRGSVGRQTLAVIVISAIIGVLIVIFDMLIQFGLDHLYVI